MNKLKQIMIATAYLLLMSCGDSGVGSGNTFGNEIDYNGYGKLKSIKFVANSLNEKDSVKRYHIIQKITRAEIQINQNLYSVDSAFVLKNDDLLLDKNDSLYSLTKPNYLIEISMLEKLDSISKASAYYQYIVGNIDLGEHVYILRSFDGILKNGDTVNVRIDRVGTFKVTSSDRTMYLGVFEGVVQ